jgi:hypothetical protein
MYIFEIGTKRRIFYTPFDLFIEKKFASHHLKGTMNFFEQGFGSVFIFTDPDPEDPDGGQYGYGYGSGSNTDPGL